MINIDLDFIGKLAATIMSVVAVAGLLYKWLTKAISASTKDVITAEMKTYNTKIDTKFTELEQKILELNEKLDDFSQRETETNEMLKRSLLASSRDRINQAHSLFMSQNFIGAHSLFVLDELYASYKELGGNSFIDRQMEDLHKLEVVNAETIQADHDHDHDKD